MPELRRRIGETPTPEHCRIGNVMRATLSRAQFAILAASSVLASWPARAKAEGAFIQDVAWSPDGSQLLFSRGDIRGPMHLFLIRGDGSGVRQITTGAFINE